MKYLRKLYDWVLHWAETPYGSIALFLIAFAESSFFPIPPDALLIALVLGSKTKAFRFATNCTVGSLLGGIAGYLIGHFVWWSGPGEFSNVANFFFGYIPSFTHELFYRIQAMFEEYNFWIIFTAGFTPIPYKVFTISAGAFDVSFVMFLIASVVSRGARFFLVAALLWKYGEAIKQIIDKYFDWLALAFTVLLIGGFVVIKFAI
ncbi:MAG: DedA family protein [Ignavibacteriales bacterium]|nr:MAG: DedA family protein [Ignavibacteriaceae bacterium]MBW7871879.1 DedA family protein [Ignavibacteria bacterium]MCZ2144271.1 DedA family protein [Ignavibacteriales bacterium]OQY71794.1 MAG: cytochrome b [Ignavibacteriales bacterium UTCHB3]MBV6446224.1 hypothetical protein [Ignavibacteriaceae bacterium]